MGHDTLTQLAPSISIVRQGDELLVDARHLHTYLEIATRFNDWIVRRLADALATEGEDFYSRLSNNGQGRPSTEYMLTLDLAKELAMLERSELGRRIRRYFIEAEKQLRSSQLALPNFSDPVEAARAWADAKEGERHALAEAARQRELVETLTPQAESFQALMTTDGTYSVAEAAKLLKTGEGRLFKRLRDERILMDAQRSGTEHHNVPYQQYLDQGYFTLITRPRPDGKRLTYTPRVTPKGLDWLRRRLNQQVLLPEVLPIAGARA